MAAFLAKMNHKVTLCDVVPELIAPAASRGIIIEGAENLTQTVSHTCTSIDDLPRGVGDEQAPGRADEPRAPAEDGVAPLPVKVVQQPQGAGETPAEHGLIDPL